jgi:RNA polymerase sigma factor (sigma-70 family)
VIPVEAYQARPGNGPAGKGISSHERRDYRDVRHPGFPPSAGVQPPRRPELGRVPRLYRTLIFGYLRSLNIKEHDANDLTQEVFWRLINFLPRFTLDRQRARFRTYLWKLTYNTLVDRARRRKVRDRAEDEWVRRFSQANEAESRRLRETFALKHRQRILDVALQRVRATVSPTAWACFEGRLPQRRPAADVAAELKTTTNSVFVHASRVLKEVRRRCAEIEGEPDDCDLELS